MIYFLAAYLVLAVITLTGGLLYGVYVFYRATGSWRERLKLFGGGT